MADRATILTTLARQRTELEARYRQFDPELVRAPCTDSEDPNGERWSPLDHLGHLLRIERAFLSMAERTVTGDRSPVEIEGSTWEEKVAQVHRDNETHVTKLRSLDVDALLADLDTARLATLAFIERLSDDDLDMPIPGAPWGDGTIGGVLMANAGHEHQHLAWVDEALST
jgi:hypothetical protein